MAFRDVRPITNARTDFAVRAVRTASCPWAPATKDGAGVDIAVCRATFAARNLSLDNLFAINHSKDPNEKKNGGGKSVYFQHLSSKTTHEVTNERRTREQSAPKTRRLLVLAGERAAAAKTNAAVGRSASRSAGGKRNERAVGTKNIFCF